MRNKIKNAGVYIQAIAPILLAILFIFSPAIFEDDLNGYAEKVMNDHKAYTTSYNEKNIAIAEQYIENLEALGLGDEYAVKQASLKLDMISLMLENGKIFAAYKELHVFMKINEESIESIDRAYRQHIRSLESDANESLFVPSS